MMYSMIAPDSDSTTLPSVMTGAVPNGCSALYSAGASRVTGSRSYFFSSYGTASSSHSQTIRSDCEMPRWWTVSMSSPLVDQGVARFRQGLLRAAETHVQLLGLVVDDQHVQQTQHVHAQQQRGLVRELPVIEDRRVGESHAYAADHCLAELDRRRGNVVALLHVERDADDFLLGPVARAPVQGRTQRLIADRALGARVAVSYTHLTAADE